MGCCVMGGRLSASSLSRWAAAAPPRAAALRMCASTCRTGVATSALHGGANEVSAGCTVCRVTASEGETAVYICRAVECTSRASRLGGFACTQRMPSGVMQLPVLNE